jgi:hypothetical protein
MSPNRLPETLYRELRDLAALGRAQQRPPAQIAAPIAARADITLLWAWRLAKGWSRAELLQRLHQAGATTIDESMVWRWETGERDPSRRHLDRLCQAYQTRPDLLGYGHDYTPVAGQPGQPEEPAG